MSHWRCSPVSGTSNPLAREIALKRLSDRARRPPEWHRRSPQIGRCPGGSGYLSPKDVVSCSRPSYASVTYASGINRHPCVRNGPTSSRPACSTCSSSRSAGCWPTGRASGRSPVLKSWANRRSRTGAGNPTGMNRAARLDANGIFMRTDELREEDLTALEHPQPGQTPLPV